MKILAITPFPPQVNGAATSVYQFLSRLSKKEHKIHVISYLSSYVDNPCLVVSGMAVGSDETSVFRGIKFILKAILRGISIAVKMKPDLIYAKNITSPSFVAFVLSIILKRPLVVHTSGGDIQELDPHRKRFRYSKGIVFFITKILRMTLLKKAKLIIANCQTDFSILTLLGFKEKTILIRNGVDIHRFRPDSKSKISRSLVIGYVGKPYAVKNPQLILELGKKIPNKIYIVGINEKEILKFGYPTPNVKLVGRVLNIEDYYRKFDIFVQTSSAEGLSNALLEAMASGVVPISYPSGDAEYVIESSSSGFVCNTIEEIEEKIKLLEKDREYLKTLKERARNYIVNNFNWTESTNTLERELKKLVLNNNKTKKKY